MNTKISQSKNYIKNLLLLLVTCFALTSKAQKNTNQQVEVLTLGVFHFNFPNPDVNKIQKSDQIDILKEKSLVEIKQIVEKLAAFQPTIIVIENQTGKQAKIDSLFSLYLQLDRQEEQQIGFSLAKKMRLKTLDCVDEWGGFDAEIQKLLSGKDTLELNKFVNYFESKPEKEKVVKLLSC